MIYIKKCRLIFLIFLLQVCKNQPVAAQNGFSLELLTLKDAFKASAFGIKNKEGKAGLVYEYDKKKWLIEPKYDSIKVVKGYQFAKFSSISFVSYTGKLMSIYKLQSINSGYNCTMVADSIIDFSIGVEAEHERYTIFRNNADKYFFLFESDANRHIVPFLSMKFDSIIAIQGNVFESIVKIQNSFHLYSNIDNKVIDTLNNISSISKFDLAFEPFTAFYLFKNKDSKLALMIYHTNHYNDEWIEYKAFEYDRIEYDEYWNQFNCYNNQTQNVTQVYVITTQYRDCAKKQLNSTPIKLSEFTNRENNRLSNALTLKKLQSRSFFVSNNKIGEMRGDTVYAYPSMDKIVLSAVYFWKKETDIKESKFEIRIYTKHNDSIVISYFDKEFIYHKKAIIDSSIYNDIVKLGKIDFLKESVIISGEFPDYGLSYSTRLTHTPSKNNFEIFGGLVSFCPACKGSGKVLSGSIEKEYTNTKDKYVQSGTVKQTKKNYLANERVSKDGKVYTPTYTTETPEYKKQTETTKTTQVTNTYVACPYASSEINSDHKIKCVWNKIDGTYNFYLVRRNN